MKRMKKIALISMLALLALLACGSVFAKGKKDKAEAEETVVEKPAPQVSPYNEDIAK